MKQPIDISLLIEKAKEIRTNAYAPYSNFKVAAAVLSDTAKIYVGVNVENASFGLGICAERNAIFSGVSDGMKRIEAIAVIADTKGPVRPCGACRQVLSEFCYDKTKIALCSMAGDMQIYTIEELLPLSFTLEP